MKAVDIMVWKRHGEKGRRERERKMRGERRREKGEGEWGMRGERREGKERGKKKGKRERARKMEVKKRAHSVSNSMSEPFVTLSLNLVAISWPSW